MRKRGFVRAGTALVLLSVAFHCYAGAHEWVISPPPLFTYSRVARDGHFDIHGFRQDTAALPVNLLGLEIARRRRFRPSLRYQIGGQVKWGHVDVAEEYNVPLTDGTVAPSLATAQEFLQLSLSPELHYLISAHTAVTPYLRAGLQLTYTRMVQIGRQNGSGLFRTPVDIPSSFIKWSPGVSGFVGVGFDVPLSRQYALSISGYGSYGIPISFEYEHDLPLESITYWEAFRSVGVQVAFVLK